MSGFTPGPWHIHWNHGMAPRIIGIFRPGQTREIADVKFHNGSDDPQVHDNARLIAAAPELLEALELLLEETLDVLVAAFGEGPDHDRLEDVPRIKNARAAIAKARGES